ncbi:MAG: RTX toxin [Chloracidobacterium sp.]|nr:RTX toxin [Chloracidobacterium sp.]
MTQRHHKFTKRYFKVIEALIVVVVVSSILLSSGCSMTSNRAGVPSLSLTPGIGAMGGTWIAQGPGPAQNGGVRASPNDENVGAIATVAPHPTDANILYVGAVNGGIWRTSNATAANPSWTPLTDNLPSLSIGALEFDPTDTTNRTLVAGIGRFSSFFLEGGPLTGILRTTDGGDNWEQIQNSLLNNQNISGIVARGATLLASSDRPGPLSTATKARTILPINRAASTNNPGVFRSADGGITWVQISGGSGLPAGAAFDLVGDPNDLNRFYVTVQGAGIFRSDNSGVSWTNISSNDATLGEEITNPGNNNAEMVIASNGRLYVIVAIGGETAYIGFTDNPTEAAPTWTAMDLPKTEESDGAILGINPGKQGQIHLSIVPDRNDPNIVYVGGDTQEGPFPNFIGANDFTGRLFRGDTRVAPTGVVPSPQWKHLTDSNSITQIPGGGTANNTSPHADSRHMKFDTKGDLIEVDDGGIFLRTNPQNNTGDWFSINSNIQTTEFHDIAYDSISKIIIGGAQDTGIMQQKTPGSIIWDSVPSGDGGDVAVDNITLAASNQSIRYSSSQNLMEFHRDTYDKNNTLIDRKIIDLMVVGGPQLTDMDKQFVTPLELNAIDPRRLVIFGSNAVYESFDQGDTITQINGPKADLGTPFQNAMAYGGRSGGAENPDVLYVGSGSVVYLRTSTGASLDPTAALPSGAGAVRDIALDPDDWKSAYVVNNTQVFRTTDAGVTWTDITGNLSQFNAGNFNTNVFVGGANKLLLVGTNAGVYVSFSSNGFTTWEKLGLDLPNAPVWDLVYDATDDILVAGTLGRGAWTITNLRNLTPKTAEP